MYVRMYNIRMHAVIRMYLRTVCTYILYLCIDKFICMYTVEDLLKTAPTYVHALKTNLS